jgi:hypothetical protein
MFSIELKSKGDVKSASLDGEDKVFIEGSIGSLIRAHFVEDLVLEVIGCNGELRVDLAVNDLYLQPCETDEIGESWEGRR